MKKTLLSFVILSSIAAKGQYTITSASSPSVGDVSTFVGTNTTGLVTPATGTGKYWNYTSVTLNTLAISSTTMVPMSAVPNASLFPGATIAEDYGNGDYGVYKNTSSSWILMGDATSTASSCSVFNDPITLMSLPFSYNSSMTDAFSQYTSTYTLTGNIAMLGSGTGTLALPGATLTNVLLVSQSYTQTFNYGTGTDLTYGINYSFFSAANKTALFSISTATDVQGSSTTISTSGQVNKAFTVLGIKEYDKENSFQCYPNPASANGVVILEILSPGTEAQVSVIDISGRSRLEKNFNDLTTEKKVLEINLPSMQPGIYLVKVKSGNKETIKKLVVH